MTKTILLCKMAAILKKGTILDFQMDTKLQEMIPVASKTYKWTPKSFKSADFIMFRTNPHSRCRMVAILNFQMVNRAILIRSTN